jgi:hypothetical protein
MPGFALHAVAQLVSHEPLQLACAVPLQLPVQFVSS